MVGGGTSRRGRGEGSRGGGRGRGRGWAFDGLRFSSFRSRISAGDRGSRISAGGSSEGEQSEDTRSWGSATNPLYERGPTEIAPMSMHDSLVNVQGYRVKPDVAPLLRRIFAKHGDIARNSDLCSLEACSWFLETVCSIVQKLQSFDELSSSEVSTMLGKIQDLETVGFDVGWLRKKFEDERMVSDDPLLKAKKTKIEEMKQLVENFEAQLATVKQNLGEMMDDYEECERRFRAYLDFGLA